MVRVVKILASGALVLAFAVAPVAAQTAPSTPPPTPSQPGALAPSSAETPKAKQVEGPVKKVDPAAQTVQVGWFLGLLRTTLDVNGDTQILSGGQKVSLLDIREGTKVKASYESRDGKNIAKSIVVLEEQAKAGTGSPGDAPPPSAPMGASIPTS